MTTDDSITDTRRITDAPTNEAIRQCVECETLVNSLVNPNRCWACQTPWREQHVQ